MKLRRDLKTDILGMARRLFNEYGYNRVSMRQIAEALNISVGNLTYYYNRKEDLIEAVIMEMHAHVPCPPAPTNLAELDALFTQMLANLHENAYYYWHYAQLSQISPRIRDVQLQTLERQYAMLSEVFGNLNRDGWLVDEEYAGQYGDMIKTILLICVYWMPQSRLEEDLSFHRDFSGCIWSVIYPLLTAAGKRDYAETIRCARLGH